MDITRKEYEKNYNDSLSSYKNDYEDKSEKSFLEVELNSYTKYYNSLKKISHFIKTTPKNNLGHYPITSEFGWELEIINEQVYNEIITKKKAIPEEDEFKRLLYPGDNAPSIEINIDNLNNRILSAKSILEFIIKKQHSEVPGEKKNDNAYKNNVWFKFGVLFASGEMEKYYSFNDKKETLLKHEYSAPSVAIKLGDIRYIKYISATINNYNVKSSNSDKNIFNSRDHMLKIISHCNEKEIPVTTYFTERLPSE